MLIKDKPKDKAKAILTISKCQILRGINRINLFKSRLILNEKITKEDKK